MGFMDSEVELNITFKNKRAILKFIIYYLRLFFILPVQIFLIHFRENFGKSKIYKKVANAKIVEITLFSVFWAVIFSFLVYWIELIIGVAEDGIFLLPGMIGFFILMIGILRLSWIIIVQSMEVLVTFTLSLIETILILTTEKVYK